MIGMWKVMPALAAGCSIVIKPSETTRSPCCAWPNWRAKRRAAGRVQRGHRPRHLCGKALTEHPLIAKVSFTGSTPVGSIARRRIA